MRRTPNLPPFAWSFFQADTIPETSPYFALQRHHRRIYLAAQRPLVAFLMSILGSYFEASKRRYREAKAVYNTAAGAIGIAGTALNSFPLLTTEAWGPYVLVCLPLGATVAFAIALVRSKNEVLRERFASDLVDRLHRRWFAGEHGVMDPDHRVTLYVPQPDARSPKTWKCIARSGNGKKRGCDWPHPTQADETSGPVVFVARNGMRLDVPGVPESKQKDAEEMHRYRAAVRMTEETAGQRTWPAATISVRMFRAPNGTVPAVIIVERKSGAPIEAALSSPCWKEHAQQLLGKSDGDRGPLDGVSKTYNPIVVELELAAAVASALWES